MRRSLGIAVLASLFAAAGSAAEPRTIRVGWLTAFPGEVTGMHLEGLRTGLASFGYRPGRNLVLEEVSANGALERVPALAEELVRRKVDVIVTQGPAVWGVQNMSAPIPVVYGYSGDPVEARLAESLAKPRGNMTGQTYMSIELNGKRLELLREILPNLRSIAVLANPQHPGEQLELADTTKAAGQLGIEVSYLQVRDAAEIETALQSLKERRPQALVVFPDELTVIYRQRLADFAAEQGLPLVSGWSAFARSGALFTYGPRISAVYRGLARYVVRIANGARPEELPIERPTEFELVLNMKTARALGITFPRSILLQANELIE